MNTYELVTDAEMLDAPEWAWELAEDIVLGNQGSGNAAALIHRAFTAQLAEARASERAAVVAWLRLKTWKHYDTERDMLASFAAAIEAGEHLT